MSYAKRIVKGTTIAFSFSIISAFIGYLLRIFAARELGPYEYGLFYGTFALVAFLGLFNNLGLNETITKFVAEFNVKNQKEKIKGAIIFSILMRLIIFSIILLLVFFFSNQITAKILNDQSAEMILKILLLSTFLTSFSPIFQSALRGLTKIKEYAFSSFSFILLVFIFALLILPGSRQKALSFAYCYIIGGIISGMISFGLFVKSFPSFFQIKLSIEKSLVKKIIFFALPTFAYSIAFVIISYTDTIMISLFRTVEEVGLYQVAIPTARMILYFAMALSTILLPVFSEMWAKGEKRKASELLFHILKISLVLALPFSLIFIMFPSIVINLFFGSKYIGATTSLRILSVGYLFYILSTIHFNLMNGIGKPILTMKIVYTSAGLNVLLNLLLIPSLGIEGAAIASMLSLIFSFILSEIVLHREFERIRIPLKFPINSFFKTLACGMLSVVVIYTLKGVISINPILELLVVSLISFAVYFVAIFRFKVLTLEDLIFIKEINLPIPRFLIRVIKIVVGG